MNPNDRDPSAAGLPPAAPALGVTPPPVLPLDPSFPPPLDPTRVPPRPLVPLPLPRIPRVPPWLLFRVRKNVLNLTTLELQRLRQAFEGLYAVSSASVGDDRGYQWIAGVHGLPLPFYCQHGNLNFLTWHRAYLYEFEQRLRDQVPGVTLPYWDWTAPEALTHGMPAAFTDETYVDANGVTKPNPLRRAFCQVTNGDTERDPGSPADLAVLKTEVDDAIAETDFSDFSIALENPHGGLHVWVGGDMGGVRTSAYDPIFWFHHANVDRLWWEWQRVHGDTSVPAAVRAWVAAPFTYSGDQILTSSIFRRIRYAATATTSTTPLMRVSPDAAELPSSLECDLGVVPEALRRARLHFLQLKKTSGSHEIRVFINVPDADATTPTLGNPRYGGSVWLFGHGPCAGAKGHCEVKPRDPDDARPEHHLTPYDTFLDVTSAVRAATRGTDDRQVQVSFVVLDPDGALEAPNLIEFEGVALVAE